MNKIYNNLNIETLIKTDWFNQFDEFQKNQINWGLEDNLDVSFYINPKFDFVQMNEIRLGLLDNLNVSIYAKEELDFLQMEGIRLKLLKERNNL